MPRLRHSALRQPTRTASLVLSLTALLASSEATAGVCQSGEANALYEAARQISISLVLPSQGIEPDALVLLHGSGFDRLAQFDDLSLEFVSFGGGAPYGDVHVAEVFSVLHDREIATNAPFEILPGSGAVRLVSSDCTYIYRDLGGGYGSGYSVPPLEIASAAGLSFSPPYTTHQSHPNATSVLYLDFNGHHLPDFDAELSDLLQVVAERYPGSLADIEDIWRRVAEDYAPFDVNVTTDPLVYFSYVGDPNFQGEFERVVVGGDQDDAGYQLRRAEVGGVADVGSHTSIVPYLYQGSHDLKRAATIVSHESAHQFSFVLLQQTGWLGDYISHRGAGRGNTAAIMGTYYDDRRDIWTDGRALDGYDHDEVQILATVLGHRPDLQGPGQSSNARLEAETNGTLSAFGVIETVSDEDAFAFVAESGTFTVQVKTINQSPDDHAANLKADIELWRQGGTSPLPATVNRPASDELSAEIEYTVGPGEQGVYYVVAKSYGEYGDLGQYSVFASGGNLSEVGSVEIWQPPADPTPPVVTTVPILPPGGWPVFTPVAPSPTLNVDLDVQGSQQSGKSSSSSTTTSAPRPTTGVTLKLR